MKRVWFGLTALALAAGCDDSDETGAIGTGGGSASLPSGGTGGTATGGTATGGTETGGTSGAACGVPERKLNDACPTVTTANGPADTLLSTCSNPLDEVCEWLDCGEPWSRFDANACFRPACRSSAECGPGERCAAVTLFGQPPCVSSSLTDLRVGSDCECNFGETGDCSDHGYCLAEAEHPAANDCETAGKTCTELERWRAFFEGLPVSGNPTDFEQAQLDCRDKLEQAMGDCSG